MYREPREIVKALALTPLFNFLCFTFQSFESTSHGNSFHFLRSTEHSDRARFHRMSECPNLLTAWEPGSVNTARDIFFQVHGELAWGAIKLSSGLSGEPESLVACERVCHSSRTLSKNLLGSCTPYAIWSRPYFPWRHLRSMSVIHFHSYNLQFLTIN